MPLMRCNLVHKVIEFRQFCGARDPRAKTTRFFSSSPLCGKDKMVPTGSNHWGANQMSRA